VTNPIWAGLNPYWVWIKLAVAVAALCGAMWAGWEMRDTSCDLARSEAQNAALEAVQKDMEHWQQKALEADEKLAAELAKPKAAPKIREIVIANPSNCVLPKPVADGLRDAIRQANSAG
jgi:hypothetical protein